MGALKTQALFQSPPALQLINQLLMKRLGGKNGQIDLMFNFILIWFCPSIYDLVQSYVVIC